MPTPSFRSLCASRGSSPGRDPAHLAATWARIGRDELLQRTADHRPAREPTWVTR